MKKWQSILLCVWFLKITLSGGVSVYVDKVFSSQQECMEVGRAVTDSRDQTFSCESK